MDKKTSDLQLNELSTTLSSEPENSGEVNSSSRFQTLKRKTHKAATMLLAGNYTHFWVSFKRHIKHQKFQASSIPVVNIVITQKCTLKCKGCSNLMQYYQDPQNLSLEQICRDVDALFQKVEFVETVIITGGEPQISKNFIDVIDHISKYRKQYGELVMYTNGTICPSDNILNAMKKYRLTVNISNYGKHSVNLDKLVSALKQEKIQHVVNKNLEWKTMMALIDGDLRTDSETESVYKNCQMICALIMNGKFYRCAFLTHGDELRIFPESPENYVDLLDPATNADSIVNYMNSKTPHPGCKFCSGWNIDSAKPIPTAEQIKEPLPYVRHETVHI